MKKIVKKLYIKIVSPVHIGCDEVYEPTSFVVDEKTMTLTAFDLFTLFERITPNEQTDFSKICLKGTIESILEVYKFLQGRKIDGKQVDICSGLLKHYRNTLSIPVNNRHQIQNQLNRFSIGKTAFNTIDSRPYIPGSAIKGSLRTAYLNYLAALKKIPEQKGRWAAAELEIKLLGGKFATDPFRLVKVSDFMPAGNIKTKIIYAVNKKKRLSRFDARGPYQIFEVIQPGSIFTGEISIGRIPDNVSKEAKINNQISPEKLLGSLKQFYGKEKENEEAILKKIGVSFEYGFRKENSFPIRIGHHCGAESVTVEGHRSIKVMRGRGEPPAYKDHATTTWIASDEQLSENIKNPAPFGWAELGDMTAEVKDNVSNLETARKKEEEIKKQKKKDIDKLRLQAEIEEKRIAAEKEQREIEEKRKREKFEALPIEEQVIIELDDDLIEERRVFEIYNALDEYKEEYLINIAKGLKKFWVSKKKWKKKQCSRKQVIKVQKIKGILEE